MGFPLHLIVEYNHVHVVERSIIDQFSRASTRYTCTLIYIRLVYSKFPYGVRMKAENLRHVHNAPN